MDGLVLTINRDFLKNLENRGLKVDNLKIRYLIRDIGYKGNRYKPFDSLSIYTNYHSSVMDSSNPLCSAGEFPIIENIEIHNENLYFKNEYRWYNITQSRTLVESIAYDSYRQAFQESEVIRYKQLMNNLFNQYVIDINNAISVRLNSYVDPCYVDAGYVQPNSEPQTFVGPVTLITPPPPPPPPPPSGGLITITGGVADFLYSDLGSAIAYIQTFTGATVTDTSFNSSTDEFKFTVPAGSDFAFGFSAGFLTFSSTGNVTSLNDPNGLITKFGPFAFEYSSGTHVLGSVEFGTGCLSYSDGTYSIDNITLTNANDDFGLFFTGTMNIYGDIGPTEGNDYINILRFSTGATVNVLTSKMTSNAGGIEGDVATAGTNGSSVNFIL
jgi:hypothetical protein